MHLTYNLPETRLSKLRSDGRREARYNAQRNAIAQALESRGLKMFKVTLQSKFQVNDRYQTPLYYENGFWSSPVEWCQELIDFAIAGI